MSYIGSSILIPCNAGGLNYSPNIDTLAPTDMVLVRNINLHEGGRGKRGGTAHVNSSAISGAPQIVGLHDFILQSGSQFIVKATADGKIYKNDTDTIKTGLTVNKITNFEVFDDTIFVCNGADRPQTWDGAAASTSDITSIPSDWTGANFPKQMLVHGKGASRRMWALGFVDGSIYGSENEAPQDFSDANVQHIVGDFGDGFGNVGGVVFQDNLFVFGKKKTLILDDSSTTVADWGFIEAAWSGGAASHRAIVKTPNDIHVLTEDLDIYSVMAVQETGDYKAASITKPAYVDRWLRENAKRSSVEDFHGIYDPQLRAVRWFIVRNGKSTVDTALLCFIDRQPMEAWVIHDNTEYDSGYSASCAGLVRYTTGDYRVYTGDYAGFVWRLETANKNDNNNAYYAGFKTPQMAMDNAFMQKAFWRGRVVTSPEGNFNLQVKIYIDGAYYTTTTVSLAGTGAVLDSFILDTDVLGGQDLIDSSFAIGSKGKRIQLEVYSSNINEDFFDVESDMELVLSDMTVSSKRQQDIQLRQYSMKF